MNTERAIFTGCVDSQKKWGNHTGDTTLLQVGEKYTIIKKEVHSYHTKVFLEGFEGSFNSVCFRPCD